MLKVRVENLGQIAILHFREYIVIGSEIEVLRKSVSSQTDAGAVVLDLKRVSRIDARGLGLLLELREQLQSRSIDFHLMDVSSLVEQILKMTCLDAVFEIALEEEIRSRDALELVMDDAIR